MEIKNKRVLVLGGAGLVGMAICRRLLSEAPAELIVASLGQQEAREACEALRIEGASQVRITPSWGDIFLRDALQGRSRRDILNDPDARRMVIADVLGEFSEEVLLRSHLFQLLQQHQPQLIIDCINSATAVAYQDIFTTYFRLNQHLQKVQSGQQFSPQLVDGVEQLLCTLYVPQLIRHVQLLYESMRRVETEFYFKIGTSGTGGMGLNIPYTHSEEKPSRVLLSKSSIAGAHTMLLFLMARTPDAPITKEIKPTAAIAWKRIAYGPIRRSGQPVQLFDCGLEQAVLLKGKLKMHDASKATALPGQFLESVYIDTGENGIFSQAEFEAISSSGQMELITPEEIAKNVVYEVKGGNTGHDIINALDNATMGPTYRAGLMRERALKTMRELSEKHGTASIAFELLGPPRLSKLLFEAHILKLCFQTMEKVLHTTAEALSAAAEKLIIENQKLRTEIISIGIPILLKDGLHMLRGPEIKIPPYRGDEEIEISPEKLEKWAQDGWVDLRPSNMKVWQRRIGEIMKEIDAIPPSDSSSQFDRNRAYWLDEGGINVGKLAGWILGHEEHGLRMKA